MHMHTVGLVHQLHHCTIVCIPGTRVLSDPADVQGRPQYTSRGTYYNCNDDDNMHMNKMNIRTIA